MTLSGISELFNLSQCPLISNQRSLKHFSFIASKVSDFFIKSRHFFNNIINIIEFCVLILSNYLIRQL